MSGASSQSEAGMTLGVVCRDLTGWAGWCWAFCYVLGVVVVGPCDIRIAAEDDFFCQVLESPGGAIGIGDELVA